MDITTRNIKPFFLLLTNAILVIPFLILPSTFFAQQNRILTNEEILSTEQGLISRGVLDIYEASDGFVWFGTMLGLCRYDGATFQTYGNKIVIRIFEDRNKNIWFVGRNFEQRAKYSLRLNGAIVNRLDVLTKEVITLNDHPDETPFPILEVTDINQDKDYNLWFSTSSGKVYKYDGKTYELIYDNQGISKVGGACQVRDQNIILIENKQLVTLDLQTRARAEEAIGDRIESFFIDDTDRVWFLVNRVSRTNSQGHQTAHFNKNNIFYKDFGKPIARYVFEDADTLRNEKFSAIWFDRITKDGKLWRLEGEEVKSFDRNGKFLEGFHLPNIGINRDFHKIRLIKNTSGGVIWLVELDGIHKYSIQEKITKTILKSDKIESAVSTRGITKLDENNLLIGSYYYGLIKYNLTNHSFKKISHPNYPVHVKNLIFGTSKDEYGRLWIGTGRNEIMRYDQITNAIEVFNGIDYPGNPIVQLQIPFWDTASKKLWLGSLRNGLYYLDESKGVCRKFDKYNDFEKLKDARIRCFHQSEQGLWAGSSEGLFIFDEEQGVTKLYNELLSKDILGITEDEKGVFWMGTADGLLKWNPKTNEQRLYSKKDHFSDNYIYSVHLDDFGFLWLPSNLGLMRFNPETEEVHTFLPSSGITNIEFNFMSNFTDENGVLYLGTVNGVNIIDPKDFINKKERNIELRITDFKIANEKEDLVSNFKEFSTTNKIDFLPGYKSIQVEFAVQDFSVNGTQKYAYKIRNYIDSWTYIDENYIRLNKLPFGNFDLMIKGIGGKGIWSEPVHIQIRVPKPFYLTTPALLSYVFMLLLAIYVFVKWRLMILEKRQQKLENLVKERTEELSEKNKELEEANRFKDKVYSIIAHDLRGPAFGLQGVGLKLNYLIKTEQFEELQNFGGTVEESISNLNALLDNLLKWANQNMKSITINKEPLVLNDLIKHSLLEQKMSYSNKNITIENKVGDGMLLFADKQTVLTIFRNLIANAIKFTPEQGEIIINSEQKEEQIIIKIKDTGVGISPERIPHIFDIKKNQSTLGTNGEAGTGLGLGVCMDLALLNMGILKVASKEGEGTTFYIVLPAHYQEIYA